MKLLEKRQYMTCAMDRTQTYVPRVYILYCIRRFYCILSPYSSMLYSTIGITL